MKNKIFKKHSKTTWSSYQKEKISQSDLDILTEAVGMNKIAQKVSEETAETIIEAVQGKKKLAVRESCDLLYHLIVMWSKLGIKPSEIWNELDKRMKKSKTKKKKI